MTRGRWATRTVRAGVGVLVLGTALLGGAWLWVVSTPFPKHWLADSGRSTPRILDRHGASLRLTADTDGGRTAWVSLDEISPHAVAATLASEDHRFESHVGVDPWAILRAGRLLWDHGKVYSGASTITMQLARLLSPTPPPRTYDYKLEQAVLALRLERSLSKQDILTEYLNRLPYGNNAHGIQAASTLYFGKPASDLTLAEATFLAALPRAPSWYNPYRHLDRTRERQRHILDLMHERGDITPEDWEHARHAQIAIQRPRRAFEAPHFVAHVAQRHADVLSSRPESIVTTLDLDLQKAAEGAVEAEMQPLMELGAQHAAVVVVDNASGDVLAMVGSSDWRASESSGQFNGATARRPSGTILAPFVFAAAFERGMGLTTVFPDVPIRPTMLDGRQITVRNPDGQWRGPVRAREALSAGLEVPLTQALEQVGNSPVMDMLREMGAHGLDLWHVRHGTVRASGLGRISLMELTSAFAALANGGKWMPPTLLRPTRRERWDHPAVETISPQAAGMVIDALADEGARRVISDGPAMPFPVAVSHGRSDGHRDLWTLGATPQVTVGVWVGRFDGRAWTRTQPESASGPIFRRVMMAAMAHRTPTLFARGESLAVVDICPLSGLQASPSCPHSVEELTGIGDDPTEVCHWHVEVPIDVRSNHRAGPSCGSEHVVTQTFVRLPPEYREWTAREGLRRLSTGLSPQCPVTGEQPATAPIRGTLLRWPPSDPMRL